MFTIEKVYDNQFLLRSEGKATLKDIAVAVIQSSYELAGAFGMGFMRPHETELTKEMALKMLDGEDVSKDYVMNLNKKSEVHMDYVFGRCCKTYVTLNSDHIKVIISIVDRSPTKILALAKTKLSGEVNG